MYEKEIQKEKIVELTQNIYDKREKKYPKWNLNIEEVFVSHGMNRDRFYSSDRLTQKKNKETIYILTKYNLNKLYKHKLKLLTSR